MENIFKEHHPDIVFHAAAYKHVPMMEENPQESVRVNAGGTKTVADLSIKYSAEKFIMISSDKAVNPANVMGASKRLCELYVHSLCKDNTCPTKFVTTRFGNVLGSNGSVIPIFKRQIETGGPVTVTHRDITRYFMTIPEACQLVLEAAFMGQGGEIFVFDMGEPVKIYDLAKEMIKLSGFIPGEDIMIEVTGLRPGEKLYEELLSEKEKTLETYHQKIMIANNGRDYDDTLNSRIVALLESLYSIPKEEVVRRLKELVPEFKPETTEKVVG
jgi:FlaA1/EpsC-like NDP-sugar epimerase